MTGAKAVRGDPDVCAPRALVARQRVPRAATGAVACGMPASRTPQGDIRARPPDRTCSTEVTLAATGTCRAKRAVRLKICTRQGIKETAL